MNGVGMLVMFVSVLCVFTLVMGAGLTFYQNSVVLAQEPERLGAAVSQMTALIITLMFASGAILFLAAAVKWAGSRR